MKTDKHGPFIAGADFAEILLGEVGGTWRESSIYILMWFNNEVNGEFAMVCLVVGIEDSSAVVDLGTVLLNRSPHSLNMTVEEKGIHLACRSGLLTDLEQVSSCAIFLLEGQRRRRMSEANLGTTEPIHIFLRR